MSDKSTSLNVCLICLKRFAGEGRSHDYERKRTYQVRVLSTTSGLIPPTSKDEAEDIYTRFLKFVIRYFKLSESGNRFLIEARNFGRRENGRKIEAFCGSCGELIQYICDVYAELQSVKLHLVWKVGQIGEVLKKSSKKVTKKLATSLTKTLSEQLNILMWTSVRNFRVILRNKCSEKRRKEIVPKVLVPRGLFPDEWKFTYLLTKQALTRLIVVFTLASSSMHTISIPESEALETKKFARPHRKCRRKVTKQHDEKGDIFVKQEPSEGTENETNSDLDLWQDADGDGHDDPYFDDNDSNWSEEGNHEPESSMISDNPKRWKLRRTGNKASKDISCDIDNINEDNDVWNKKSNAKLRENQCNLCSKKFFSIHFLNRHLKRTHNIVSKYDCPKCEMTFSCLTELTIHCRESHSKKELTRQHCKKCGKDFMSKIALSIHQAKLHNISKRRVCNKCGDVFYKFEDYCVHRRLHHAKPKENDKKAHYQFSPEKIRCDFCPATVSRHHYFYFHFSQVHTFSTLQWICECPICHCKVTGQANLKEHLMRHDIAFPCETCDKVFIDEATFSEHTTETHNSSAFFCHTCGMIYPCSSSLRTHLNIHEVEEKQFFCMFCHSSFSNQQGFEEHTKYEHFSRGCKIFCDEVHCSEDFSSLNELRHHLKIHLSSSTTNLCSENSIKHEKTMGDKDIHVCPICGWEFLNKINAELHELVHTQPLPNHSDEDRKEKVGYGCRKCDTVCPKLEDLYSHYALDHKILNEPYSCPKCDLIFVEHFVFKTHLRIHHEKESGNNYTCESCNRQFTDKLNFHAHRQTHDPSYLHLLEMGGNRKRASCDTCGVQCNNYHSLLKHLKTSHEEKDEAKTFWCCYCYKQFAKKQTQYLHMKTAHQAKGKNKLICDDVECSEIFCTSEDLNKHLLKHVQEKHEGPYPSADGTRIIDPPTETRSISYCKKCNLGFLTTSLLSIHELCHIAPNNDSKEFQCPGCSSSFPTAYSLQIHWNTEHGVGVKPFKCSECKKEMFQKASLFLHMAKRHSKVKPEDASTSAIKNESLKLYECTICSKKCQTLKSYTCHLKRHDPKTYKFSCQAEGCDLMFLTRFSRDNHEKRAHNIGTQFPCQVCGKLFTNRSVRSRHMVSHEENKYECTICNKFFKRPMALKTHLKLHDPNSTPQFVCSECGMSFKSEAGLTYHMASIHQMEDLLRYCCLYCPKRYYRFCLFKMHMETCMKLHGVSPDDKEYIAAIATPPPPTRSGKKISADNLTETMSTGDNGHPNPPPDMEERKQENATLFCNNE